MKAGDENPIANRFNYTIPGYEVIRKRKNEIRKGLLTYVQPYRTKTQVL